MQVVRLVCWKQDLAQQRASTLQQAGLHVDASPLEPGRLIGQLRANLPAAVLIDLDRLPSHGREVAVAIRNSKTARHIPIVFAGGLDEKVARIRQELPDALFTDWKKAAAMVKKALKMAVKSVAVEPVRPTPHMQRYAGSSLAKKLGFKAKMKTAFVGAPDGFEEGLGELPEGLEIASALTSKTELTLWFVRSRKELESEIQYFGDRLREGGSLWIIHPKKAGRYKVDFNQNDVRAAGLLAGMVDYKVCAVDEDWSGLKFSRKKTNDE